MRIPVHRPRPFEVPHHIERWTRDDGRIAYVEVRDSGTVVLTADLFRHMLLLLGFRRLS